MPTRLQYVHTETQATATTIAQAITVTAGSALIVIGGNFGGTSVAITDVRDDLNNVGTVCAVSQYVPNFHLEIWLIENVTGGARTVTITFSATHVDRCIGVIEVSGLASGPLDQHINKDTQDSTNPNTAAVTTTADGEYCVGAAVATPGTSLTATAPFADVVTPYPDASSGGLIGVEDQIQSAAGSTNAAWTAANSSWCAALATFKAAAAAPAMPYDLPHSAAFQSFIAT